tara:strand:+ start:218 stop:496 length:279 start_codon:yes stop_codon:yes gene_type:complete
MNEQELIRLGDDSESLLKSDSFNTVINTLVDGAFQAFVNSKPDESENRERCYTHYRACVDILNTLRHHVSVRDEINTKLEEENNTGNNNQED